MFWFTPQVVTSSQVWVCLKPEGRNSLCVSFMGCRILVTWGILYCPLWCTSSKVDQKQSTQDSNRLVVGGGWHRVGFQNSLYQNNLIFPINFHKICQEPCQSVRVLHTQGQNGLQCNVGQGGKGKNEVVTMTSGLWKEVYCRQKGAGFFLGVVTRGVSHLANI